MPRCGTRQDISSLKWGSLREKCTSLLASNLQYYRFMMYSSLRRFWLPTFLAVACLFSLGASAAVSALDCQVSLSLDALAGVPNFQGFLKSLQEDQVLTPGLKLILTETLLDNQTHLIALNEEVRKELNLEPTALAFANRVEGRIVVVPSEKFKSVNSEVTEVFNENSYLLAKDRPNVGMSDLPQNSEFNETMNRLGDLIHELAHVKLGAKMSKEAPRLVKILPTKLFWETHGEYFIDSQLSDFLQERYAAETEFGEQIKLAAILMSKLNGKKYRPDQISVTHQFLTPEGEHFTKVITLLNLSEVVEDVVIRSYGIKDPRVLAFRGLSVSDILRGRRHHPI